jgi:hypothetical protein
MAYKRSVFPESGFDTFQELYDIPASKIGLVQEFQTLKTKPYKTVLEQNRLNQLTQELQLYILDPNKWNLFCDAVTGLQKFFLTNVNGYIDAMKVNATTYMNGILSQTLDYMNSTKSQMDTYKSNVVTHMNSTKSQMDTYKTETLNYMTAQKSDVNSYVSSKKNEMDTYSNTKKTEVTNHVVTEKSNMTNFVSTEIGRFENTVVNFVYRGQYANNKSYSKWNGVTFDGNLFISKLDGNLNNQPPASGTENTYWYRATEKGSKGQDGTNLVYKGLYNNSTAYLMGNLVNYNGVLYYAKVNTAGVLPTNTTNWEIFPINVTVSIQAIKPSNNYSGHIWLETL